jgi:hypothetical protein
MDYKSVLNAIAYNQLEKAPYIPDVQLGIGDAESLESHSVLLQKNATAPVQKETTPTASSATYELSNIAIGENLDGSNYIGAYFVGNPIEGV